MSDFGERIFGFSLLIVNGFFIRTEKAFEDSSDSGIGVSVPLK